MSERERVSFVEYKTLRGGLSAELYRWRFGSVHLSRHFAQCLPDRVYFCYKILIYPHCESGWRPFPYSDWRYVDSDIFHFFVVRRSDQTYPVTFRGFGNVIALFRFLLLFSLPWHYVFRHEIEFWSVNSTKITLYFQLFHAAKCLVI